MLNVNIAILQDLHTKGNVHRMSQKKILLKRVSGIILKACRRKYLTKKACIFSNDVYLNFYFHNYFMSLCLTEKFNIPNILKIIQIYKTLNRRSITKL